ncbi:MAG: glutamate racemase [Paludibacteraceae bacterium]|nr:glutamate racemase [Paludibacteraceae bacterium]
MIGVFDSGYGGLTILEKIRRHLPEYDYVYLGDNARAPYGTRSFEVIYEYTLQSVRLLFEEGCRLVILACNTASAKALRSIQMHDIDPARQRVLGVIRPTVEAVIGRHEHWQERHIGVLATPGTVSSGSYEIELRKQWEFVHGGRADGLHVTQQACPMLVPLIESGEHLNAGADWFVDKYIRELLERDPETETVILGCTHYPLLRSKIELSLARLGSKAEVVAQGDIVAVSLADYLQRHTEIERDCTRGGTCRFLTTESGEKFAASASIFLPEAVAAEHVEMG